MCTKYISINIGFPLLGGASKLSLFPNDEFRRKRSSDDNKRPGNNRNGFYKAAPKPRSGYRERVGVGFKSLVDLGMLIRVDEISLASLGHRSVAL